MATAQIHGEISKIICNSITSFSKSASISPNSLCLKKPKNEGF